MNTKWGLVKKPAPIVLLLQSYFAHCGTVLKFLYSVADIEAETDIDGVGIDSRGPSSVPHTSGSGEGISESAASAIFLFIIMQFPYGLA